MKAKIKVEIAVLVFIVAESRYSYGWWMYFACEEKILSELGEMGGLGVLVDVVRRMLMLDSRSILKGYSAAFISC